LEPEETEIVFDQQFRTASSYKPSVALEVETLEAKG
jgi:hypothetical protein